MRAALTYGMGCEHPVYQASGTPYTISVTMKTMQLKANTTLAATLRKKLMILTSCGCRRCSCYIKIFQQIEEDCLAIEASI